MQVYSLISRGFFIIFFKTWTGLQETMFNCLEETCCIWAENDACKYWDSSGFEVCARMLFATFHYCCGPRVASHIPVFLFLVPLIIPFLFFWMDIACLSIVMVHPSSHKNPNDINGDVFIFGKCGSVLLACLDLVAEVLLYVSTP